MSAGLLDFDLFRPAVSADQNAQHHLALNAAAQHGRRVTGRPRTHHRHVDRRRHFTWSPIRLRRRRWLDGDAFGAVGNDVSHFWRRLRRTLLGLGNLPLDLKLDDLDGFRRRRRWRRWRWRWRWRWLKENDVDDVFLKLLHPRALWRAATAARPKRSVQSASRRLPRPA